MLSDTNAIYERVLALFKAFKNDKDEVGEYLFSRANWRTVDYETESGTFIAKVAIERLGLDNPHVLAFLSAYNANRAYLRRFGITMVERASGQMHYRILTGCAA